MLPVDEEFASWIRDHERRLKRLETLEQAGGGDWVLIETIEIEDDGDSVEFTDIPQIHQHLFILYSAGAASIALSDIQMNFNNDVGNSYNHLGTIFSGVGGQFTDVGEGVAFMNVGRAPNEHVVGNRNKNFSAGHIFIADYRGTLNYKTMVFSCHYDVLGALEVPDGLATILGGGTWEATVAAITETDFVLEAARDFRAGTVFSLYGVN